MLIGTVATLADVRAETLLAVNLSARQRMHETGVTRSTSVVLVRTLGADPHDGLWSRRELPENTSCGPSSLAAAGL